MPNLKHSLSVVTDCTLGENFGFVLGRKNSRKDNS